MKIPDWRNNDNVQKKNIAEENSEFETTPDDVLWRHIQSLESSIRRETRCVAIFFYGEIQRTPLVMKVSMSLMCDALYKIVSSARHKNKITTGFPSFVKMAFIIKPRGKDFD